jgi:hypothetical protein
MKKLFHHHMTKGLLAGASATLIFYAIAGTFGFESDALGAFIGGLTGAVVIRLSHKLQVRTI